MYGAEHSIFFDRTFLVTGATEGLGPEIARGLIARGAYVLAVDRDPPALAALHGALGDTLTPLARDLADPSASVEIARWIADDHPRLAGLICNAAGRPGREPDAARRGVFGPAALAGLLWPTLQSPGAGTFALVLPKGDFAAGLGRLASTLRETGWHAGRRSRITAVTVSAAVLQGNTVIRRKAAGRALDAINRGKPHLRLSAGWSPAEPADRAVYGACPAGGTGRA